MIFIVSTVMILITVLAYIKGKSDAVQQLYEVLLKGATNKKFQLNIKDAHFDVEVSEVHYGE